jgi:sugar lactone lactonase YvrE
MAGSRLTPLLDGGRYFEAPRWHDHRLWLVDSRARTLISVTGEGTPVIACTLQGIPAGLGFLQNGEAVVTDIRVAPDGRILDRIPVPGRRGIACVLGGDDRKTLFCVSMDPDRGSEAGPKPQSYVDAAVVEVPGAGYP